MNAGVRGGGHCGRLANSGPRASGGGAYLNAAVSTDTAAVGPAATSAATCGWTVIHNSRSNLFYRDHDSHLMAKHSKLTVKRFKTSKKVTQNEAPKAEKVTYKQSIKNRK